MSYPLWAILGSSEKKFVLLLGRTRHQAKQHLMNIKKELEMNPLLKKDLGPFQESDEWGSHSLVIPYFNARITAASTEQSIRGMRHGEHRPDLIICDDIEDLASVKTIENRDKVYQWLTGEVIPAGDVNTKLIMIGNLLHHDSLLMRMKRAIDAGRLNGIYREYPLLGKNNESMWPGKFKDLAAIEAFKKNRFDDERAWQREFLLHIIPDEDQVVQPEWIQYYDHIPLQNEDTAPKDRVRLAVMSVDLAISQKDYSDCTAIVSAKICGRGEEMRIYIDAYPVNKRMNHPQNMESIYTAYEKLGKQYKRIAYVEDVSYQKAVVQILQKDLLNVEGVGVAGQDKRSRLNVASPYIKNGTVLFPKKGAELLLTQILGFGSERHDDLVDAFSLLVNKIIADNKPKRRPLPDLYLQDFDIPGEEPYIRNMMYKQF